MGYLGGLYCLDLSEGQAVGLGHESCVFEHVVCFQDVSRKFMRILFVKKYYVK